VETLLIVGAVVSTLGLAAIVQAQTVVPCEAPPHVRQALRNLPESTEDTQADRAAGIAALRALLKRFPHDVYVHERYQDTAMYPTAQDRDAVIAEYRALAAKHPKDAAFAYLAARALIGSSTKEALPELEKLAPTVPPARLALVRIYQSPAFKDTAKARAQLEAFGTACPTALRAFSYMRSLEPSEFLTKSTDRLRRILQERHDIDSASAYSTLWLLEFRVKPAREHDALRKQVAEDLNKLRAMDPGKGPTLYSVLRQGYKLAGDQEGAKWAADQMRKAPGAGISAVQAQWNADHPFPKATDPPEKRKAYYDARVKATADWVRRAPDQPDIWYEHLYALENAEGVSAAEVEAAGDEVLKEVARNPEQMAYGRSWALTVADLYATKGVRPDRLADLVAQGLREIDILMPERPWPSDLDPPSSVSEASEREMAQWGGRLMIANIWLKAKDKNRARAALLDVQKLADDSKPKVDAKDPQHAVKQGTYLFRQTTYWWRMGDLAQLEGHKTDAMTYYQNALLAYVEGQLPPARKDELVEQARALWADLGGSNEAWYAWFSRKELLGGVVPEALGYFAWTNMEKTLPDFELEDLDGRKWRLADFKGKPTLVGIWATW
jgi:hypothetical protein